MPPASVFFPSRDGALSLCILNRSFCFPFEGVLWAEVTLSFYSPHNNKVALCSISLQTSSTYRDHKTPLLLFKPGQKNSPYFHSGCSLFYPKTCMRLSLSSYGS